MADASGRLSQPSHGGSPSAPVLSANQPGRSGHPVRDRLLARAAVAASAGWDDVAQPPNCSPSETPLAEAPLACASPSQAADNPASLGGADEAQFQDIRVQKEEPVVRGLLDFGSLPGLTDDLDAIGRQEQPGDGSPEADGSSFQGLVLGRVIAGVLGLAVVFGVLSQGAPRQPLSLALAVKASPQRSVSEDSPQVELAERQPQLPEARIEPEPEISAQQETPESPPTVVHAPRKAHKGPWRIEQAQGDPQLTIVRSQVGGDSFLVSMQAAGIALKQGFRVLKSFEGVRNFDRCRPREKYVGLLDRETGVLKAFEFEVSSEEIYQAQVGDDGLLRGKKLDLEVKRQRARGVFLLRSGFENSATRAGFESGLAPVVNKALAGYTTVSQMKSGDVLALIAQEVTVLGDFARYAGIEALEYRRVGEKPLRIYYQDAGKTRGYVDSKGRMFGKGRWAKPVKGAPRTSKFNPRRMHPILKVIRPHNGTDYGAAAGTPVMAAATARVKFVGKLGPNGNFIRLSHSGGYETGYSHLLRFARGLKRGDRVKQHQVIGYVGSTGRSTGPHLHFSAKKHGKFIDPESLDLDAFARLPISDRKQLSRLRKRYDQLLAKLDIPNPLVVVEPPKPAPVPNEPVELDDMHYAEPAVEKRSVTASLLPQGQQRPVAAKAKPSLSLYLTDRELMLQQPAQHSGEVAP